MSIFVVILTSDQNDMFTNKGRPPSTNDPDATTKPKCELQNSFFKLSCFNIEM